MVHLAPTIGADTDSMLTWNPTTKEFHVVSRSAFNHGNYTCSGDTIFLVNESAIFFDDAKEYSVFGINAAKHNTGGLYSLFLGKSAGEENSGNYVILSG